MASRRNQEPDPDPEPYDPEQSLLEQEPETDPEPYSDEEDEQEPCIATLFDIANALAAIAEEARKSGKYRYAIGAYNSAVQTLVTAHQLNEQDMARRSYMDRQDGVGEQESHNKRDFPMLDRDEQ